MHPMIDIIMDPFEILSRAVQFDEYHGGEPALLAPLETASLYYAGGGKGGGCNRHHDDDDDRKRQHHHQHHQQELLFHAIVYHLTTQNATTQAALDCLILSPQQRAAGAVTPIVLSGLIAREQQQQQRRRRRKEEEADVLLATDEVGSRASAAFDDNNNCNDVNLLLSCQLLRQSALRRFRWRTRQMTLVRYGFLVVCFVLVVGGTGMLGWYWWYRVVVVGQEEIEWRRHLAGCDGEGVRSILDDNESGIRRGACRLAQTALFLWPPTTTTTATTTSSIRLPLFGGAPPPMMTRPAVPPTMHTLVYNMMAPGTTTTATSGGMAAKWYWRWRWSRTGGIVKYGNKDDDDGTSGSAQLLHRMVREVIVQQQQGMMHRQRQRHTLLDVGCGVGSLYDHVRDVVDAYHGVALTGPEIELARTEHHQHQNCPASASSSTSSAATATFQQHDFLVTDDDDSSSSFRPDSSFSTIVAIDSLVYGAGRSNKLRSVLDHLIRNALQPGGLFIIVDDGRYGDDDNDATTSKNDDLWTYQQWQETLEQLGCPMVFARDLSLEYWLDFATPIHIYRNSGRRWWFHFLDTMLPADDDLDELLRHDQQRLVRHWQRRQQRHRDAQLMYHLYACRRRPVDDDVVAEG
jgi:SAM-dependent methyltransferase